MANRKQSFVSQEHLVNGLYQEARPVASAVSVAGLGFALRLSGPQVDRDLTGRKALPSPLSFSLLRQARRDGGKGGSLVVNHHECPVARPKSAGPPAGLIFDEILPIRRPFHGPGEPCRWPINRPRNRAKSCTSRRSAAR